MADLNQQGGAYAQQQQQLAQLNAEQRLAYFEQYRTGAERITGALRPGYTYFESGRGTMVYLGGGEYTTREQFGLNPNYFTQKILEARGEGVGQIEAYTPTTYTERQPFVSERSVREQQRFSANPNLPESVYNAIYGGLSPGSEYKTQGASFKVTSEGERITTMGNRTYVGILPSDQAFRGTVEHYVLNRPEKFEFLESQLPTSSGAWLTGAMNVAKAFPEAKATPKPTETPNLAEQGAVAYESFIGRVGEKIQGNTTFGFGLGEDYARTGTLGQIPKNIYSETDLSKGFTKAFLGTLDILGEAPKNPERASGALVLGLASVPYGLKYQPVQTLGGLLGGFALTKGTLGLGEATRSGVGKLAGKENSVFRGSVELTTTKLAGKNDVLIFESGVKGVGTVVQKRFLLSDIKTPNVQLEGTLFGTQKEGGVGTAFLKGVTLTTEKGKVSPSAFRSGQVLTDFTKNIVSPEGVRTVTPRTATLETGLFETTGRFREFTGLGQAKPGGKTIFQGILEEYEAKGTQEPVSITKFGTPTKNAQLGYARAITRGLTERKQVYGGITDISLITPEKLFKQGGEAGKTPGGLSQYLSTAKGTKGVSFLTLAQFKAKTQPLFARAGATIGSEIAQAIEQPATTTTKTSGIGLGLQIQKQQTTTKTKTSAVSGGLVLAREKAFSLSRDLTKAKTRVVGVERGALIRAPLLAYETRSSQLTRYSTLSREANTVRETNLARQGQPSILRYAYATRTVMQTRTATITPELSKPPEPPGFTFTQPQGFSYGFKFLGKTPRKSKGMFKRVKSVRTPWADLLSLTQVEARTLRPATSPSEKTANRFFNLTAGLRIPASQQLTKEGKLKKALNLKGRIKI